MYRRKLHHNNFYQEYMHSFQQKDVCEKSCKTGQLFDIGLPIDIVLTFEFCHEITIWKMTIFDKVN